MNQVLPIIEGVAPSSRWLPAGSWKTVFDFLCESYPGVSPHTWLDRMSRHEVRDETGACLNPASTYRAGACIFYYREFVHETSIPFSESIVYQDENLLVVDKPHFLPVVPAGRFVRETLLARLLRRGISATAVPIHRLDRETAGLVLFSLKSETRGHYTALFRERKVRKTYQALCRMAVEGSHLPVATTRRSRIVQGEPFFRMREVEGAANAETQIELLERESSVGRYQLRPITGKKHQLRVHLAALGIPIINDRLYPDAAFQADSDPETSFERPLQLLAYSVEFTDPVTGRALFFESELRLESIGQE